MLTQTTTSPCNVIDVRPRNSQVGPCTVPQAQPWQGQLVGSSGNENSKGKCFKLLGRGGTGSKTLPFPSAPGKGCQLPLLSVHSRGISRCCAARRRHSQVLHWHRVLDHHLDDVPRGQELSQGRHRSPRASLQKAVGYLIAVVAELSHALLMQAGKRSFKPLKSFNVLLALHAGGV